MSDTDDIVKEFLVESYENLDRLDRDLINLEKSPEDREILASVFRTIHTIKGTSGFLAFDKLGAVTHVGESLLGRLRDGQLVLDGEITTALLALVDAVRQMLACIETSGAEGERDDSALISRLTRLQHIESAKEEYPKEEVKSAAPELLAIAATVEEVAKLPAPESNHVKSGNPILAPTIDAGDKHGKGQRGQSAVRPQCAGDTTIRLDVSLLDHLMNLVGELVLARNQILQCANTTEESSLLAASQRLNLITTELQGGVMKTRMQPIGNIWSKLPRTVRDLALDCGKQVRVEMEGQETELDKTLIEAIKDPLTHIVRNSVDHGIETPAVRAAAGKDPEGRLLLRAFHEGGQVNIEISDDGAGLNQERIRDKALEKGLVSPAQASHMSDREIVNLILLPGFSTAEKLTKVSGRGVGMDVVKTHIERIGGTVDVHSKPGQGVLVRMKIPLTLAIIPALIVTSGGEAYAIPQVHLLELVGFDSGESNKGIETIHGAPVFRLRGRLLPLVYLKTALHQNDGGAPVENSCAPSSATAAGVAGRAASGEQRTNFVVLSAEGRQFGLVVDVINDTEEIVVKPLSKHLKDIPVYAGATIMGDGKVALILDVLGLAKGSSVLSEGREQGRELEAEIVESAGARRKLVLFSGAAGARMAVPLEMLARLENIPGTQVERSGNRWVTQYRGQILPLIRITHALEERRRGQPADDYLSLPTSEMLQVLVLENDKQSFGLVVNRILDIVESAMEPKAPSTRKGVLHSCVISEKVTELLDVTSLLVTGEAFDPLEIPSGPDLN